MCAAGGVLYYATENLKHKAGHICSLKTYYTKEYMILDPATRRNLEIVETVRGTGVDTTLLKVLDKTRTPMGSRLLREWLLRPLYDRNSIVARLESVDDFKI